MSTFEVTPGPLPVMVALSPQVATVGQAVTATYRAADGGAQSLAVVRAGGKPSDALESPELAAGAAPNGSSQIDTQALSPGDYEVLLVGAGGEVQARAPFWVQKPGAKPVLTTDSTAYASGRADRRHLEERACQPLGLDRRVQGERGRPERRRLPHLAVHGRRRLRYERRHRRRHA